MCGERRGGESTDIDTRKLKTTEPFSQREIDKGQEKGSVGPGACCQALRP